MTNSDCDCELIERHKEYYEDGYLVEYSERCVDCRKVQGVWAYGAWIEAEV